MGIGPGRPAGVGNIKYFIYFHFIYLVIRFSFGPPLLCRNYTGRAVNAAIIAIHRALFSPAIPFYLLFGHVGRGPGPGRAATPAGAGFRHRAPAWRTGSGTGPGAPGARAAGRAGGSAGSQAFPPARQLRPATAAAAFHATGPAAAISAGPPGHRRFRASAGIRAAAAPGSRAPAPGRRAPLSGRPGPPHRAGRPAFAACAPGNSTAPIAIRHRLPLPDFPASHQAFASGVGPRRRLPAAMMLVITLIRRTIYGFLVSATSHCHLLRFPSSFPLSSPPAPFISHSNFIFQSSSSCFFHSFSGFRRRHCYRWRYRLPAQNIRCFRWHCAITGVCAARAINNVCGRL